MHQAIPEWLELAINDLTERREHHDTMVFTLDDQARLEYLEALAHEHQVDARWEAGGDN